MTCGVDYGTAAKSAPSGHVPVLRMGNIRGTKFDWSDIVYTSDHNEIEKYLLKEGDVLFNRTNSPDLVGKTAIYRGDRPAIFAGYLIRINHMESVVDSQYLNFFLNSRVARQYGNSVKTDGVNQSNISGAKLLEYPFPYCSVEEQHETVAILNRIFSHLDEIEADIVAQLHASDTLRQTILKKAFSGQLVPQDPGDEPASVLLDRIRPVRDQTGQRKTPPENQEAKDVGGMTGKLPINLHDLLRQRTIDGERVEYKGGWNPQSLLHTICAFANDFHNLGGGYVVLGVAERDGRPLLPPKGLEAGRIDGWLNELLRLGQSAIQPPYHPLAGVYDIDGRSILVLWAPGGETRPYKARVSLAKEGKEWAYYIRRHSNTVRARGADERELLSLAATVPFDDRYHQASTPEDLSPRLIERFLRDVGSDLARETGLSTDALGRRMNIVGGPPEACFPKNVGLLFFNNAPHRFFPATQIDVVWFPDGPGGDRFEEKEFRGPLWVILSDAIDFIARNYLKETVVKHPHQPEAERFWNFPLAAIEEALVNAIYHRSYEEREPVEVRITPQELTILSFPGADRSIRMEDLQTGRAISRRYRNRRVGEFLKELDLAEGRSTGIPKILRAMRGNGSPAPVFESDHDRIWFLTRLPAHEQARVRPPEQATEHDTEKVTEHEIEHDGRRVNDHVERLVAALAGEMGRAALQDALRLTHRPHFIAAYLRPAVEAGLIEMTLPDKPTSRNQRYRRTAAGDALAQQLSLKGLPV